MLDWKTTLVSIILSVPLTGCSFSSLTNNSLIALVFSILAAIGVLFQIFRDKSEHRCARKANNLEKKTHKYIIFNRRHGDR